VKVVNPNADVIGQRHALLMNITAARGLQDVLKSNLGPKGTMKMLVSGAGAIKVTKDGKVLLDEMQIQHPTAAIIARTATAQEDMTGDGTTSNVLFTGELLAQAERYLIEGLHPRVLVDGFELAREHTLKFLDEFAQHIDTTKSVAEHRQLYTEVASTALRTKLPVELADHITPIVVNAVSTIAKNRRGGQALADAQQKNASNADKSNHMNESKSNEESKADADATTAREDLGVSTIDLHMIEIMHMRHQSAFDTRFVDGLVLDHGSRHPDMPKRVENAYIMILNVSLEYERSEVNAGLFYKDAEERERLVKAERKYVDDKVRRVIELKRQFCKAGETLVIVNQKGIDPISLDMLAKEGGIIGIRRAKRRNMERLARACGGYAINSLDDVPFDCLGYAKLVYEHSLGDDKYTFIEGCRNATSCTILVKGPNEHTIRQLLDAIHDGLRAVKNVIEDQLVVAGAAAFETAAHLELHKYKQQVQGRSKLGVAAFADALLIIPKTLASNAGLDQQQSLIELLEESAAAASTGSKHQIGLDLDTGKPFEPSKKGIWDSHRVKKQFLHLGSLIAIKLLLVDEVMRAGRKMGKG